MGDRYVLLWDMEVVLCILSMFISVTVSVDASFLGMIRLRLWILVLSGSGFTDDFLEQLLLFEVCIWLSI